MTNPDELLRLAERAERGSGEDRGLSAEIFRDLGDGVVSRWSGYEWRPENRGVWQSMPDLTSSLDAVEALRERLLPGSFLIVQHETPTQWRVALHMEGVRWEQVTAPTEARARLAALLRAYAATLSAGSPDVSETPGHPGRG